MIRAFFVIVVALSSQLLSANNPDFHIVSPKSGDGVYSLLGRYQLTDNSCNVHKFYELNHLKKNEPLLSGKKYVLPVYIYEYNGKSIRSTIGVDDWDLAVGIKNYNENIYRAGLRKTHYVESKILWVPYSTLSCRDDHVTEDAIVKMVSAKEGYEPLFGKKYSKYNIEDSRLKGKVYYIVSGHGGPDPGAMCKSCPTNLCEDEYAYDVSARLARNLMQHGATVHLIVQDKNDGIRDDKYLKCDKDEICAGKKLPLNQKNRLKQRTDAINNLYYKYKKQGVKSQEAIFIHVDSRNASKRQDVFFYHYRHSKSGAKLAKKVQDTFEKKYDRFQKGRGYHGYVDGCGLYVLRNAAPTSLFVELANIRNKSDHKRLLISSNRQALANWLFEGITN